MAVPKNLPIFCDKCPTLAFAVLNGAPLCEKCLFEQVSSAAGTIPDSLDIEPLEFVNPPSFHDHPAQWI